MMLPHPSGHTPEGQCAAQHATIAARMRTVERRGNGCVLEHAAATECALDRLKASCAAERALAAQMLESLLTTMRCSSWPLPYVRTLMSDPPAQRAAVTCRRGHALGDAGLRHSRFGQLSVCALPFSGHKAGARAVQVLSPLQAAVLCIQAHSDVIYPLHVYNLVAIQRGVLEAPPGLHLAPERAEAFMRPFLGGSSGVRAAVRTGAGGAKVPAAQ
jgi:hypothetical protein